MRDTILTFKRRGKLRDMMVTFMRDNEGYDSNIYVGN